MLSDSYFQEWQSIRQVREQLTKYAASLGISEDEALDRVLRQWDLVEGKIPSPDEGGSES